jgi:hypothetical protein
VKYNWYVHQMQHNIFRRSIFKVIHSLRHPLHLSHFNPMWIWRQNVNFILFLRTGRSIVEQFWSWWYC